MVTKTKKVARLTFYQKIADIRKRLNPKVDSENPGFKRNGVFSRYLSQAGLMAELDPLLEEHELLLTQTPEVAPGGFALVTIIQEIAPEKDADGVLVQDQHMLVAAWPIGKDLPAQKKVAETTYAARATLVRMLAIVADADDDGNFASGVKATTSTGGVDNLLAKL